MTQIHLALPGLYLPESHLPLAERTAIYAQAQTPSLQSWLGRSRAVPSAQTAWPAWLGTAFGIEWQGQPIWPAATLQDRTGQGHWLHADPIHIVLGRDNATLHSAEILNIQPDEADALISAINTLFADDGLVFVADTPSRWRVKLPAQPSIQFTPLTDAIDRDLILVRPQGENAKTWDRWLNEIQMLCYNHPVNDARAAQGQPLIHGTWFWGDGLSLADLPAPIAPAENIYTQDLSVCETARRAGCVVVPLSALAANAQLGGVHWAWVDTLHQPAVNGDISTWQAALESLDTTLFSPLEQALVNKHIQAITLVHDSPRGIVSRYITAPSRWRFWQGRGSLTRDLL